MKRRNLLTASLTSFLAGISIYRLGAQAKTPAQASNQLSQANRSRRYACKILAIDGGGIRGVIPAYILQKLEARLGKQIYECFDVIAGTSTGGIITMGLTTPTSNRGTPYTASEILDFYLTQEKDIFVYQSTGDFEEAKYYATKGTGSNATGIEPWLQSKFTPTMTLTQARQQLKALGKPIPKQVLTTCYTMNGSTSAPYLFNWVDATHNSADNYYIWEAARATSAAPTYFPIARVGSGTSNGSKARARWAADGGVAANNPALYALAWASRLELFNTLNDVLVVSLGTGLYNTGIRITGAGNWGTVQWLDGTDTRGKTTSPLENVLAMSNVLAPGQQLSYLMPQGHYFRLEPQIPYSEASLDGTDTQHLLKTAKAYIEPSGEGHSFYQAVVRALS
jgi:predicted acylesterase/phospholipase RssA